MASRCECEGGVWVDVFSGFTCDEERKKNRDPNEEIICIYKQQPWLLIGLKLLLFPPLSAEHHLQA